MTLSRNRESFETLEQLMHVRVVFGRDPSAEDQRNSKTVGIPVISAIRFHITFSCDSRNRLGYPTSRLAFACSPRLDMGRRFELLAHSRVDDTFFESFAIVGHIS